MSIVFVDNNTSDLSALVNQVAALFPEQQLLSFTDPLMSAKYICNNDVDLAFVTANMRPVDGFMLLRTLRANKPSLPIVLLLDEETQREKALCEAIQGSLVKPVLAATLEATMRQVLLQ